MNRFRPALIAAVPLALAGVCLSPLAAQDAQGQRAPDVETETTAEASPPTKGEARLAKLLDGRVAGEPVRCIRSLPSQRMTTIDRTAYVYGSGNTIYVQRTRDPDQIDDNDALVNHGRPGAGLFHRRGVLRGFRALHPREIERGRRRLSRPLGR
jgi:hypothetical protein